MSWHITLKFSSWNIKCFWQKEPINVQFFRLLSALMKFHPIPQMPFLKPLGRRVYFASLFSFMKDNSVFFFSSNLIYFGKFTKSFMSYLKPHVSFSLNFPSLFNAVRDNSSVLSWLKLNMIFTKGAHQSANISFKICTLVGSFCWKYIQFQLKKVQRSYASWYWRLMQNLNKNQFVVSKLTRIWWILIQVLKSLQNLHFDWSL